MTNRVFRRHAVAAAAVLCTVAGVAQAAPYRAAATPAEVLASLSNNANGRLTSAAEAASAYNMVNAAQGAVLLADGTPGASPTDRAVNFLNLYGALAGVTDATKQLQTVRVSTDAGKQFVHMDQYQSGLPVFGARLVVNMTDAGITGVNGVFVKGLEGLSTSPAQSYATLQGTALRAAQKLHPGQALAVESSRLMFYNTGLLIGKEGSNRLAYEVMVKGANVSGIRERIILDANQNTVLNRINEIHSVLNRKIYTPVLVNPATNTEATPVLTEGSALVTDPAFVGDTKGTPASTRTHGPGTEPLENLYIYAGGTWLLYKNLFGADGYDFTRPPKTGQVQKSVYLVNNQCPNAYWDGTSTNYCPDFDADDVVSHEWSHAYTEYTHGLVYQYQSGALNESYSDIFGETYDLINGFEGPQGATLTEGTTYDKGGSRWVVGEDLSQAAAAVLLRDMWDPDAFPTPSPGSVITSANYECGTSDNGGVHTNSGVSNHAFAMLVDGKTFNGVTVPGIGLLKAARIHFYAEKNIQTPTTNYPQHADALDQACKDLKDSGAVINDVFGKDSGLKITQADCDAVALVSKAVEFRNTAAKTVQQKCAYIPVLKPEASTPALCGAGQAPAKFFTENFEGTTDTGTTTVPTGWTLGKNVTGDTDIAPWTSTSVLPYTHAGLGRALFFKNNTGGTCTTGGDQSASHYVDTPAITTATATGFYKFTHLVQSESGFDGGNLKVSVNGGAFALVPAAAFTYNAYSGKFTAGPLVAGAPADPTGLAGGNNTSPNAGQVAWTGSDQGDATSQWGTSIIDLSKLTTKPTAGGTVKFRYDFANDGCGGNLGWYVDDVSAYQCVANVAPVASFASVTPRTGSAPLVVTFDGSASSDADSAAGDKVASYTMDFGDGSAKVTQAAAIFKHQYASAGNFTASLTVTDTRDAVSGAITQAISVVEAKLDPFTFAERTGVATSSFITSETITLAGAGSAPISIAGGPNSQYSVNGGPFTSAAGTVAAGDKLVVRHTSSGYASTATSTTVTVGKYSTVFKSTTAAANDGAGADGIDRVPDAFDFGSQDGVDPNKATESKVLMLTGYDEANVVAGQFAEYRINGGTWTTKSGRMVKGQTLQVRHTSNAKSLGYTKSYVEVGGVRGYFTTRTKK